MKKFIYLFGLSSMISFQVFSQDVLVVDGGNIYVTSNGLITVKGGVLNQNSGEIDNSGNINVTGNWTNNGGNSMLMNNSPGTVTLNGADQSIKGSDLTEFYNLTLSGGNTVKSMDLDANVSNVLDLGDAELQTNSNTIFVNNPSSTSVLWNTGYVNSDSLGGYIARATNSTDDYVFPVGASSLVDLYRSVTIKPTTSTANVFGVRLSDRDANVDNTGSSFTGTTGPFSTSSKEPQVRTINPNFYYNIAHLSGSDAADVQVDFFSSDGNYQTLAQWDGVKWEAQNFSYDPSTIGSTVNSPDIQLVKSSNLDFDSDVFALAELEFEIGVPGGVSPNSDGFNDMLVIENLKYFPENEFVIFNRWGDPVYTAKPYLNDWSGQVNGTMVLTGDEVTDGTYFYILKLSEDETTEPLRGSFELRRK